MIDIQKLKEKIGNDEIIYLMDRLGIPLISSTSQYLLYPSVCHHPTDWKSHKNKLYIYDGGIAHCYSCGFHGDIIALICKIKSCDFMDAVNYICKVLKISADNIDLENGMSYTVKVVAAMNSGLTAEDTHIFTVGWGDYEGYNPELELTLNEDDYSMLILPYCAEYPLHYWKVKYSRGVYINTGEEIEKLEGEPVIDKFTKEGDQVYKGTDASGGTIYFAIIPDPDGVLIKGVTLSVYRREFDGSFTLIGKGIANDKNSYITDPHPALDYARYRVIATDTATGSIVYSDVAGLDINCPYVIVQWDDTWTPYEVTDDADLSSDNVSKSMLMIKGNIDVSDKYNSDTSLVEYIGRSRPVSYYGTQLGETSSWNMEIPKTVLDDKVADPVFRMFP